MCSSAGERPLRRPAGKPGCSPRPDSGAHTPERSSGRSAALPSAAVPDTDRPPAAKRAHRPSAAGQTGSPAAAADSAGNGVRRNTAPLPAAGPYAPAAVGRCSPGPAAAAYFAAARTEALRRAAGRPGCSPAPAAGAHRPERPLGRSAAVKTAAGLAAAPDTNTLPVGKPADRRSAAKKRLRSHSSAPAAASAETGARVLPKTGPNTPPETVSPADGHPAAELRFPFPAWPGTAPDTGPRTASRAGSRPAAGPDRPPPSEPGAAEARRPGHPNTGPGTGGKAGSRPAPERVSVRTRCCFCLSARPTAGARFRRPAAASARFRRLACRPGHWRLRDPAPRFRGPRPGAELPVWGLRPGSDGCRGRFSPAGALPRRSPRSGPSAAGYLPVFRLQPHFCGERRPLQSFDSPVDPPAAAAPRPFPPASAGPRSARPEPREAEGRSLYFPAGPPPEGLRSVPDSEEDRHCPGALGPGWAGCSCCSSPGPACGRRPGPRQGRRDPGCRPFGCRAAGRRAFGRPPPHRPWAGLSRRRPGWGWEAAASPGRAAARRRRAWAVFRCRAWAAGRSPAVSRPRRCLSRFRFLRLRRRPGIWRLLDGSAYTFQWPCSWRSHP